MRIPESARDPGDDVQVAKYHPEDQDFLLELEPNVAHYEVVGSS